MVVKINRFTGISDAIKSMFISKGNLTDELESRIDIICEEFSNPNGFMINDEILYGWIRENEEDSPELHDELTKDYDQLQRWLSSLSKIMVKHITLGRFIDFSATVRGIHRAGQDDWDAHARRFDNRILRASSRFGALEDFSDYYKDKIMTTDSFLAKTIEDPEQRWKLLPQQYMDENNEMWSYTGDGYVKTVYANNKDVTRGLKHLGEGSTFIFSCNITEFAHVYKQRNEHGTAHPEVKELAENLADQLHEISNGFITRSLLLNIEN